MQRNGSLFRSLHRHGSSPPFAPLVSVDSFNSLRLTGRSCWQAGPSAPFQGSCGSCAKAGVLPASPLKRILPLAVIPASPLLKICFFTVPQRIRPVPQAARLPARRSVFRFKYRRGQPRGIQRRRGNGFLRNAGKAHAHTLFTARGNSGNASALPTASPQSALWAAAYEFHPPRRFHCGPAPPPARFPAARNARWRRKRSDRRGYAFPPPRRAQAKTNR